MQSNIDHIYKAINVNNLSDFFSLVTPMKKLLRDFELQALNSFLMYLINNNPKELFKNLNKDERNGVILGDFLSSYNKSLKKDVFTYELVYPSIELKTKFTNLYPVRLNEYSEGFKDKQIVALFPEIFKNNIVSPVDPVFYFVDRFQQRYLKFSLPYARKSGIHLVLNSIQDNIKLNTFSNWVLLHEEFHRTGLMPIPNYLFEKSSKLGAAFEELRADLLSMKYCYERRECNEHFKTFKLILVERMFAYPLFRDSNSFDAISSYHLFSRMKEVEVYEEVYDIINIILGEIEHLEELCLQEKSKEKRKIKLNKLLENYLIKDLNDVKYFSKLKGCKL